MPRDKQHTSAYNAAYFVSNKACILEKRRANRLAMTEDEKELRRIKAREYAARRRVCFEELLNDVEELNRALDTPILFMGFHSSGSS
jgi:hypothetical protein